MLRPDPLVEPPFRPAGSGRTMLRMPLNMLTRSAPQSGRLIGSILLFAILLALAADASPGFRRIRNWTVATHALVRAESLAVQGDLTVAPGGHLILENAHLRMEGRARDPQRVLVRSGGTLEILASEIEAASGIRYDMLVEEGGAIRIERSTLRDAGWKDQVGTDESRWIGPQYTNDRSRGGHGLEIFGQVLAFQDNELINIASTRFYGSGLRITGNHISGARHEALAFFGNDCEVCDNFIVGSAPFDRETYGIRFYPGTRRNRIHHNTIVHVGTGLMVANVSPWSAGEDFEIHHNQMQAIFKGCLAYLSRSHIHHEIYRDIISKGIQLLGFEKTLIENCEITDGTYVAPEILTPTYYAAVKELCHPWASRAYWDFEMRRGAIMLMEGSDHLTIRGCTVARFPRSGYGITMDIVKTADNMRIEDNHFSDIGYIELADDILTREAPRIASIKPIYGLPWLTDAAIEVEQVLHLRIVGNDFTNCRNGITTIFPDGLGHAGDIVIEDNLFRLTEAPRRGPLEDFRLSKFSGLLRHRRTPPVGILLTGHFASTPEEKIAKARRTPSRRRSVNALIRYLEMPDSYAVRNNRLINYTYPLVLHRDPNMDVSAIIYDVTGNLLDQFRRCFLPGDLRLEDGGNIMIPLTPSR